MNNGVVIAIVSIVLVLILLVVFIYSYFYYLRRDIFLLWEILRIKLGTRLDKIPLLIEVAKKYGLDLQGLNDLVETRAKLWGESEFGAKRVSSELIISAKIKDLFALAGKNEGLKKDLTFLSQQKEIKELGNEIEEMSESFNHKVRGYNHRVGFILLRPLTLLMRFQKLPSFEFEP